MRRKEKKNTTRTKKNSLSSLYQIKDKSELHSYLLRITKSAYGQWKFT